jgi:hypothetical protein
VTGPEHSPYPAPWSPPAGPYPPYGQPPPRRRRSRGLTIGLPVLGLVVLLGGGIGIWKVASGFVSSLGSVTQAADAYATALVDQRWSDAHDLLCADSQAAVSPDDLAAEYSQPPLTGYNLLGAYVNSSNGVTSAEVTITFTSDSGIPNQTTLNMVEEDGSWRPCL